MVLPEELDPFAGFDLARLLPNASAIFSSALARLQATGKRPSHADAVHHNSTVAAMPQAFALVKAIADALQPADE